MGKDGREIKNNVEDSSMNMYCEKTYCNYMPE